MLLSHANYPASPHRFFPLFLSSSTCLSPLLLKTHLLAKLQPHPWDALLVKRRRYRPIRSALLVNCVSFSTAAIYPFPLAWERCWDVHRCELFFRENHFALMRFVLCPRAAEKQKVTPTVSGTAQNAEKPYNPRTLYCSCLFHRDAVPNMLRSTPLSPVCQPPTLGLIFLQHPTGYDYFIPFLT